MERSGFDRWGINGPTGPETENMSPACLKELLKLDEGGRALAERTALTMLDDQTKAGMLKRSEYAPVLDIRC
jgi:hypothetical protein